MESPGPFSSLTPEILVATFSPGGEVIERNDAWLVMFGDQEDPWAHLPEDDQQIAIQSIRDAASGILVTNEIFSIQSPERDVPFPVLLNFVPVHLPGLDGQPSIKAITITGEVLAEPTTWTASQTQRHRLESLGRMAMGIAHDFNNLLSGILGYTELLKTYHKTTPAADTEASVSSKDVYLDHLDTIERAALDGAALVRKIQQYIRREKQTGFEPLDLPALINDCIAFTRPYWCNEPRRQGIEIELISELSEVPPVIGSATELREVFVNLILNAVQAMPEGGKVTLKTDFDKIRGVRASISDTGIGMSETVRRRIFEPLFSTKGERGTGMGLAVTYGIVQEHEGTINVTSRLGEGTRFDIIFSPAEKEVRQSEPQIGPSPNQAARVLVIDDEPLVRSVLSKLLRLHGHTVHTAESGEEALSIAEAESFDIVFVDQAMPGMNGREVAYALRQRFANLPIVLLTGDTDVGVTNDDIDLILGKPFQIQEVEATIQRLI